MNKQTKLVLERSIFFTFVFVCFGLIIINEKQDLFITKRVEKKLNDYIEKKYNKLNLDKSPIKYKNTTFTIKLSSKDNINYFFYVKYSNKKITDTYKDDYVKGKSFLKYIEKKLNKEIIKNTSTQCKISINTSFDKMRDIIKERLLNEEDLIHLKIYDIEKDLMIENWNSTEITDNINNLIYKYNENNITPKSFQIRITNKKDITESITIKNIKNNFISIQNNEQIIKDILKNNNTSLLKQYEITYEKDS